MREEECRVLENARDGRLSRVGERCDECLAMLRERCRDARQLISTGTISSL